MVMSGLSTDGLEFQQVVPPAAKLAGCHRAARVCTVQPDAQTPAPRVATPVRLRLARKLRRETAPAGSGLPAGQGHCAGAATSGSARSGQRHRLTSPAECAIL